MTIPEIDGEITFTSVRHGVFLSIENRATW